MHSLPSFVNCVVSRVWDTVLIPFARSGDEPSPSSKSCYEDRSTLEIREYVDRNTCFLSFKVPAKIRGAVSNQVSDLQNYWKQMRFRSILTHDDLEHRLTRFSLNEKHYLDLQVFLIRTHSSRLSDETSWDTKPVEGVCLDKSQVWQAGIKWQIKTAHNETRLWDYWHHK